MSARKYYITILLVSLALLTSSRKSEQKKIYWNGYTKLRFTSNNNDFNSFTMKRQKLWGNSTLDNNKYCGYKVQTSISILQNEKIYLQDVSVFNNLKKFKINFEKFNLQYILQRFQPNYEITLTERTNIINIMITNETSGIWDIEAKVNYPNPKKNLETLLGVFNGYEIQEYSFGNSGILLTHKTVFQKS
ncbi:MAG: hypothetical protein PF487_09555 [Bacteroidales bacterium]|jgi:hypothetical protein|nr:hypothetical protein [Bacteroidales bacterium]